MYTYSAVQPGRCKQFKVSAMPFYIYIYILVINVTAACIRGCAASVGLLVTGKEKKGKGGRAKRTTDSKSTQLMWIQGIIREMYIHGGGGGR